MYSKKHIPLIIALLTFAFSSVESQVNLYQTTDIQVIKGSRLLENAFAGGLNNPQFSLINLDSTGLDDLFILDREGQKILTFTNQGVPGQTKYKYEFQYEVLFPNLKEWALIRDINDDNIPDIVAHANLGMKAYKGSYQNGLLKFTLSNSLVSYEFISGSDTNYLNVWVARDDVPGVVDVDNDGDLDILAFGLFGNAVEYYRNRSIEKTGQADFGDFVKEDACWGQFQEASLTNSVILGPCKSGNIIQTGGARHAGSTICTPDFQNDGDVDLILGDISFSNLVALENIGDSSFATMGNLDTMFPFYDIPANLPIFPGSYCLDIDQDGKEDIVASPNSKSASITQGNVWYYKNTSIGSNTSYNLENDSFLVESMIDVGENSYVTYVNYNQDSLVDILVSNYGYYQLGGNAPSSLMMLKNIGSTKDPRYFVEFTNYANVNQLGLFSVRPAFGDIDGDGDDDMIIGEENGVLHHFRNLGGAGNSYTLVLKDANYMGIDVGQFSTPHLFDLNGDSLIDIIVGDKDGHINYFQNQGSSTSPMFNAIADNPMLGNIDVAEMGSITGYADPFVRVDSVGKITIYVGSQSGRIFHYAVNQDSLMNGSFELIYDYVGQVDVGSNSSISINDINADGKMEFLVGNSRGGISVYSESIWDSVFVNPPIDTTDTSDTTSVGFIRSLENMVKVYPNPTRGLFQLESDLAIRSASIFDAVGREVSSIELRSALKTLQIDLRSYSKGMYIIRVETDRGPVNSKILLK
ncbi:MAG: T9SS type A sorting domain-containing protein [Chitinophagales bacterium]|nr:T9SS type A sorting domain-containing protein [Chitinophagales bacterium]